MPVPDFQSVMLPLLELYADGQLHRLQELIDQVADRFHLTDAERSERLGSGLTRLQSNVQWARTDLGQAGLLESPKRGEWRLTKRGQELLAEKPGGLSRKFLSERYHEHAAFLQRSHAAVKKAPPPSANGEVAVVIGSAAVAERESPHEAIDRAYEQLNTALADAVLAELKQVSPKHFEQIVMDLLVAMGYGGSLQDAATVVGGTGDGGIDGEIKEDKLGLDKIYIQAKRWDGTVGRPAVQAFVGSLAGRQATKGVFITTATFTNDARNYVLALPYRVVLIDGPALARLMIEHNVGVSIASTYHIKRIDSDYFVGE